VADPDIDERPLRRSRELLQHRVAARRITPEERPFPGENRSRLLLDSLRSPFQPGPESLLHRMAVAAWCASVLLAPSALTDPLVSVRFRARR
jgi:hypothetical protein